MKLARKEKSCFRILKLITVACLLVSLLGSTCFADIYTDPDAYGNNLTSGLLPNTDNTYVLGGLVSGGNWGNTMFSWNISRSEQGGVPYGPWHYSYTFDTETAPGLSHLIIQTSSAETGGDIGAFVLAFPDYFNANPVAAEIDSWSDTAGNVGFPAGESFFGIKYEDVFDGDGPWTVQFDSYRNPMWGSFFAKGGNDSYAYNTGLDTVDGAMVAVPDTSYVPVPGAVLLGMLGLSVAGVKLRRHK